MPKAGAKTKGTKTSAGKGGKSTQRSPKSAGAAGGGGGGGGKSTQRFDLSSSSRKGYRWVATFGDGTRVYFGSTKTLYYVQHMDEKKRDAWRAKNAPKAGEHKTAKALTYFVLQGDSFDLSTNVAAFMKRFRL